MNAIVYAIMMFCLLIEGHAERGRHLGVAYDVYRSISEACVQVWMLAGSTFVSQTAQDASDIEQPLYVISELDREGDLDFMGHPVSFGGFVYTLESDLSWQIPTIVDERALDDHGVYLHKIVIPQVHAGGVRRGSSLRFILDIAGISYYVDGNQHLIVTTKRIARVKWQTQLKEPHLDDLSAASLRRRRETVFAAGWWHVDPAIWTAPLIVALQDEDIDVQFDAAYALGEFGPQGSKAIDGLVAMLRSKQPALRVAAAYALGKIGPAAIMSLLDRIDDPNPDVAMAAAWAFAVMGSVGCDAVPALMKAGQRHAFPHPPRQIEELSLHCRAIATAVSRLDLGPAVPALNNLLKSDHAEVRSFGAFTIGEIGPRAQACTSELIGLLSDESTLVRRYAAQALARLSLPSETETAQLEAAMLDPDRTVQQWAAEALRVIKSKRYRRTQ